MDWLAEQYERERRADDLREAQRAAEIKALLEQGGDTSKSKGKDKDKKNKVRHAVGSKLIAWGEQLQDGSSVNPSTAKI